MAVQNGTRKFQIHLNPDKEFVSVLRKRIRQNNGYCPCKLERVPENKCPCEDLRNNGECECALYVKEIPIEESEDRESLFEGWV